jgi:hypothetical protein
MMTGYKGAAIRDKAIIRDADLMRGRLAARAPTRAFSSLAAQPQG